MKLKYTRCTWTFDISVSKVARLFVSFDRFSIGIDAITSCPVTLFGGVITVWSAVWVGKIRNLVRPIELVVSADGAVAAWKLRGSGANSSRQNSRFRDCCECEIRMKV